MAIVLSQVHTVIDVMQMLTQALEEKDTSQLEALARKVSDWIMLDSEKQVILDLIVATEYAIEDMASENE